MRRVVPDHQLEEPGPRTSPLVLALSEVNSAETGHPHSGGISLGSSRGISVREEFPSSPGSYRTDLGP